MGWGELFKQNIGGFKIHDYDINVTTNKDKNKKATEKDPKEDQNPLKNKRITKRSNTVRLT